MSKKEELRNQLTQYEAVIPPNIEEVIARTKGLRGLVYRIIYRLTRWMMHPLSEALVSYKQSTSEGMKNLFAYSLQLEEYTESCLAEVRDKHERGLAALRNETGREFEAQKAAMEAQKSASEEQYAALMRADESLRRHDKEQANKMGAIARDTVRDKWRLTDYLLAQEDDPARVVSCGICGYSAEKASFETRKTTCIFGGGELERYVCPSCGAVFGPTKFSDLKAAEFDDDYSVHYSGFSESDCTEREIFTFNQLSPTKEGVYLNYGCGSWATSLQKLNAEGYTVYGYEPYSPDVDNPMLITDKAALSKMRFDGIFSHDLLEHLKDPIAELAFMKSLLAKPDRLMAHATGCYEYVYEYTRFHMYFFTGRSLDVLCERAGLEHGLRITASGDNFDKYISYVFSMPEDEIEKTAAKALEKLRWDEAVL